MTGLVDGYPGVDLELQSRHIHRDQSLRVRPPRKTFGESSQYRSGSPGRPPRGSTRCHTDDESALTLEAGACGIQFEHANLARGAVDLDERSRRQRPRGALRVHYTREPELAGNHGRV